MDQLAKKLNITDQTAWNQLTIKTVLQNGGASLLYIYRGSLSKLLSSVYPEYKQACRNFVHTIMQDLKLSKVQDVATVPLEYPCLMSHILHQWANKTA